MKSRRKTLAAAALLLALPLAPVVATVHPGYDQLAKNSDLVVVGRITGVTNAGAATRTIEVTSSSLIKGRLPTPSTLLTVHYARVGKGNIDFKAYQSSGDKVVVFLKQRKDKDGKPIAEFELTDAWFGLARWDSEMMMSMAKAGFALEAFGDWIIAALGGLVVFTMTLLLLWKAPEPEATAKAESTGETKPSDDGDKPADDGATPAKAEADKPADDNAKSAEAETDKAADDGDDAADREADEPAEREADQPAEREADRPAVREADQPAEREADQAAEREADKPAERDADEAGDEADQPADDADKPADGDKPKE